MALSWRRCSFARSILIFSSSLSFFFVRAIVSKRSNFARRRRCFLCSFATRPFLALPFALPLGCFLTLSFFSASRASADAFLSAPFFFRSLPFCLTFSSPLSGWLPFPFPFPFLCPFPCASTVEARAKNPVTVQGGAFPFDVTANERFSRIPVKSLRASCRRYRHEGEGFEEKAQGPLSALCRTREKSSAARGEACSELPELLDLSV